MSTSNALAAAWGKVIQHQREHVTKETRAQLAERLKVSRQMVRLWETGEHCPSSRMQGVLIAELGIDPATVANLIRKVAA